MFLLEIYTKTNTKSILKHQMIQNNCGKIAKPTVLSVHHFKEMLFFTPTLEVMFKIGTMEKLKLQTFLRYIVYSCAVTVSDVSGKLCAARLLNRPVRPHLVGLLLIFL